MMHGGDKDYDDETPHHTLQIFRNISIAVLLIASLIEFTCISTFDKPDDGPLTSQVTTLEKQFMSISIKKK